MRVRVPCGTTACQGPLDIFFPQIRMLCGGLFDQDAEVGGLDLNLDHQERIMFTI